MREQLHDIATIPNAITATRLALSPLVAKRLHDDPGGTWYQAAAFLATDNIDGFFARLGEHSETLANLGFRTSEWGRRGDPAVDTIVTSEMIVAGLHNGVIPKWLGAAALAQKAVKSKHGVSAAAQGIEVHVSKLGKRSEFLTNTGMGLLFPVESIEDDAQRKAARLTCITAATAGILGATIADLQYRAEVKRQAT